MFQNYQEIPKKNLNEKNNTKFSKLKKINTIDHRYYKQIVKNDDFSLLNEYTEDRAKNENVVKTMTFFGKPTESSPDLFVSKMGGCIDLYNNKKWAGKFKKLVCDYLGYSKYCLPLYIQKIVESRSNLKPVSQIGITIAFGIVSCIFHTGNDNDESLREYLVKVLMDIPGCYISLEYLKLFVEILGKKNQFQYPLSFLCELFYKLLKTCKSQNNFLCKRFFQTLIENSENLTIFSNAIKLMPDHRQLRLGTYLEDPIAGLLGIILEKKSQLVVKRRKAKWTPDLFPSHKDGDWRCADCNTSNVNKSCSCGRYCWRWCNDCYCYRSRNHKVCKPSVLIGKKRNRGKEKEKVKKKQKVNNEQKVNEVIDISSDSD